MASKNGIKKGFLFVHMVFLLILMMKMLQISILSLNGTRHMEPIIVIHIFIVLKEVMESQQKN